MAAVGGWSASDRGVARQDGGGDDVELPKYGAAPMTHEGLPTYTGSVKAKGGRRKV